VLEPREKLIMDFLDKADCLTLAGAYCCRISQEGRIVLFLFEKFLAATALYLGMVMVRKRRRRMYHYRDEVSEITCAFV
jgi:hypothetical protein